jgi:gluconolactonase
VVAEDAREDALGIFIDKLAAGTATPRRHAGRGRAAAAVPTSVCFAVQDLRTVYVGSLAMSRLPTFPSPCPDCR